MTQWYSASHRHKTPECSDPRTVPIWIPQDVHHYLAHIGAGISIRDLARLTSCHASTMSRRIRRIEAQRDDPLIDAALRRMETDLQLGSSALRERMEREITTMTNSTKPVGGEAIANFEKEACRILRRLCETGAVLAIAKDMDMAVVVREGAEGSSTRTAVVSQEIAQAIALRGWIETQGTGRILRYSVTSSGREKVRDLIGQFPMPTSDGARFGAAEAPVPFDRVAANDAGPSDAAARKTRYGLGESPLTALARRRDKDGKAFLADDLVRCGERLREDFELAQMGAQADQSLDRLLTAGATMPTPIAPATAYGPEAARGRVVSALKDLGPGLSDVALRCCCYLEGLETTEKQMGWSARSGKVVLRIALQRLKRHYDETLTQDAQMIG